MADKNIWLEVIANAWRFVASVHTASYLESKADDSNMLHRVVMAIATVFCACIFIWDYAVDPVHAANAYPIRLFGTAVVFAWMIASWPGVNTRAAHIAALTAAPLVLASYMQAIAVLDQGIVYGLGSILFFYIFVPTLMIGYPLGLTVAVLFSIAVWPPILSVAGGFATFPWDIYNAYAWMGLFPVLAFVLLNEYLYWSVYRHRRDIRRLAITDDLTGLVNRRQLRALGTQYMASHARQRIPLSLLFLDLDRFKQINDRHGHPAGDEVLRRTASALKRHVRTADLAARYGGEEFVMLLSDCDGTAAEATAERVRLAVMHTVTVLEDIEHPVDATVSIGIATWQPWAFPDIGLDDLLAAADEALLAAKRQGHNCIVDNPTFGSAPARTPLTADNSPAF